MATDQEISDFLNSQFPAEQPVGQDSQPTTDFDISAFLSTQFGDQPTTQPFLPRFGKALITMPVRVAKNIAQLGKKETLEGLGQIAQDTARFSLLAGLSGQPGIPSEMRQEFSEQLKESGAGELSGEALMMFYKDALEPFGFTITETVDPSTGELVMEMDHAFETVKEVLATEPERHAEIIATLLSGGSTALASKSPRLANALRVASEFSEPLGATGRLAKIGLPHATRALGVATSEALGSVLFTGKGGDTLRRAFSHPTPEFLQALRGKIEVEGVLTDARQALFTMKAQRGSRYRDRLATIKGMTDEIDLQPVRNTINNQLSEFRISRNADGTLNFSRSAVNRSDWDELSEAITMVDGWGNEAWQSTPIGLDTLKRRLDDYYSDKSSVRAFIAATRARVKQALDENVLDASGNRIYAEMTKDYEEATKLIKDIERSISLRPTTNPETTLKKITTALKQDNDLRLNLLQQLQDTSGVDLIGIGAGQALSGIAPSNVGLSNIPSTISIVGGFTVNPQMLLLLPFQSPRLMGEFAAALGMTNNQVAQMTAWFNQLRGVEQVKQVGRAVTRPAVISTGSRVGRVSKKSEENRR